MAGGTGYREMENDSVIQVRNDMELQVVLLRGFPPNPDIEPFAARRQRHPGAVDGGIDSNPSIFQGDEPHYKPDIVQWQLLHTSVNDAVRRD